MKCGPLALALGVVVGAGSAGASQPEVFSVEGYGELTDGDLDGVRIGPEGVLTLGPEVAPVASGLTGPVLALARADDGALYAATAAPGRIWRLGGKEPQLLAELKEPIVTALVPFGRGTLAAITAPKGGVRLLSTAGKELLHVAAPDDVELLLGATVLGDRLYVVGGGDEGVLLSFAQGEKAFTRVAKVEAKHLRAVAARDTRRGPLVVVGTADDGKVFRLEGTRLVALVDASPDEVIDLEIDAQGRVFAAFVDANGALTETAGSLAKTDVEEGGKEKKKEKDKKPEKTPRKVKGGEVARLDPDGVATVLWQSKKHGPYALALRGGRVVVGTGPHGRLYDLDPEGRERAAVIGRAKEADEVVAFVDTGAGLAMATAHPGGVQRLTAGVARQGIFLSDALDAGQSARLGRLAVLEAQGTVKASVRTGYTQKPDETWSSFSPVLTSAGVPAVVAGRYAQVKLELTAGDRAPSSRGARLAYLRVNRPPSVVSVEVVAPGWKVTANPQSESESRSVSFGRGAFKKYLDQRGSLLPKLEERGGGKQSFEPGFRTVYAWVEDEDQDLLRYRFELRPIDARGQGDFTEIKPWSSEAFVSLDASRLADGDYQVRVHVDDLPSNGPARAVAAQASSPVFAVRHAPPTFAEPSAARAKDGVRLRFRVAAALPLSLVRCSVGAEEWTPVDPADGILDASDERFDVVVPGDPRFGAASCQAIDEGLNESRIDLPVR